jgi:chromosome transmission fidelity protein 1
MSSLCLTELLSYSSPNIHRLEKTKSSHGPAVNEVEPTCTKIYYTSRTHSQLSQVLHELEKLNISLSPSSVVSLHHSPGENARTAELSDKSSKRWYSDLDDEQEAEQTSVDIRTVSLASRKQLCINEKLKAKAGDLDEACRQLLSGKRGSVYAVHVC